MKKAYSVVMSLVLCFSLVGMEAACSSSQVQNVLNTINTQLPIIDATVTSIAGLTNDPKLAAILNTAETAFKADAPLLSTAIAAYNSGNGKLAGAIAAANALAAAINPQVEAANRLVSPGSEKQAMIALAIVAAAVNGFALSLSAFGKSKTAQANYQTVAPFIPQAEKGKVAQSYGYTLADAQAIGL